MIQPDNDRTVEVKPAEDITWEDGKYVQGTDPVKAIVGFETVNNVISDDEGDSSETKTNGPKSKSIWPPYRNREKDPRGEAARRRNHERVERANKDDEQIIGKFLPENIRAFFSFEWDAPELEPKPEERWIEDLKFINGKEPTAPRRSRISFDLSPEGLNKNLKLLKEANFDLTSLLDEERGTTVGHGSEFRPVEDLRMVLRDHPYIDYIDQVFTQGMNYYYKRELSEKERREELEHVMNRGNHKSALNHTEKISKLLAKDVKHGFAMPLPAEAVKRIPGALVQPCGCAEQFSLESDGSRIPKLRLTHDLSFSLRPDLSVNDRVDMSQYPEMVYGFCLSRIIHFIVSLRAEHPDKKIFLEKADYSEAYRRISHHPEATAASIIVWEEVAYLMLRLAFGGSPNPACFSGFSETLTDLANELSESDLRTEEFSLPTVTPELRVPEQYPNDEAPLAGASKPAVHIPLGKGTRKDCFLDDVINVFLGTEDNLQREPFIVPLAVDLMSRRHLGNEVEPIFRKALLQYEKRLAEGRPSEIRIVLGWGLDTRLMTVFLPDDKFLAWRGDLNLAMEKGKVTIGDLESLLGRLNHAAHIIPLGRHFLGCIRRHIPKSGPRLRNKNLVKRLSPEDTEDLKVWEALLKMAHEGIPMDILTVRHPTHLAWTDSCPFGLGGYTLKGRAFRLKIPVEAAFYGESVANNFLEFLAQTIGILLNIEEAREEGMKFPCFHSLGDNTTAIGWLFKSGRIKKNSVYYEGVRFVARHLAHSIIDAKAQLCPQHWPGKKNLIPDLLSFHGTIRGKECSITVDDPPNDILTQRIREHYPQLVPESFQISPLPPDITSFVCRALQILELSWIRNKKRGTKRSTEHGGGGRSTWTDSESTIRSLIEFPDTSDRSFSSVSLSSSEKESSISREDFLAGVRGTWYRRLSEVPQALWVRRSGCITGEAPCTSREGLLVDRL